RPRWTRPSAEPHACRTESPAGGPDCLRFRPPRRRPGPLGGADTPVESIDRHPSPRVRKEAIMGTDSKNGPITSFVPAEHQEAVAGALQQSLVDLIDLSLVAKQLHWSVVGPRFQSVHLALDE